MTLEADRSDSLEGKETNEVGDPGSVPEPESWPEDELQHLGREAIEQLAFGLNRAATTIKEFGLSASDEERLKQLNDEQLLKLLEEAYHSKKLDDKNKSAIFKEILEDVHDSISTSGPSVTMSGKSSSTPSSSSNSPKKKCPTSIVTIPAPSRKNHRRGLSADDSSSTKTEIEEMDQFSDLEDNNGETKNTSAKSLDENGNPVGSVNYASRQLRPLSIYRHDPAFHSQHVSVNQIEGSPPPHHHTNHHHRHSPSHQHQHHSARETDSEEPPTLVTPDSTALSSTLTSRFAATKSRRKKKAVTKDVVKAEDIDGYRGDEDLDRILEFIESKPDKDDDKSAKAVLTAKRSRRTDRKSKRSRTPSAAPSISKETSVERPKEINTPNVEISPVPESEQPRAESSPPESITSSKPPKPVKPSKPSSSHNIGTLISSYITNSIPKVKGGNQNAKQTSPNNRIEATKSPKRSSYQKSSLANVSPEQEETNAERDHMEGSIESPGGSGEVYNCESKLDQSSSNNYNEGPVNNATSFSLSASSLSHSHTIGNTLGQERMSQTTIIDAKPDVAAQTLEQHHQLLTPTTNSSSNIEDITTSLGTCPSNQSASGESLSSQNSPSASETEMCYDDPSESEDPDDSNQFSVHQVKAVHSREDLGQPNFNYQSILKFVKNEWDIVTFEISNGSSDIQSKIVYYKSREKYTN